MTTKNQAQTGLVGLRCEVTDEHLSFAECLSCAQRGAPGCPMVPSIIHTITTSIRDPEYANDLAKQAGAEVGFSVTELLSCSRQYQLKRQYPYWEKPSSLYRMARGTAFHALLSEYPEGIREETLTWKYDLNKKTVLLVGTPDLIEVRPEGWYITDYKVTDRPPQSRRDSVCSHCESDLYLNEASLTCPNCGPVRTRADVTHILRAPRPRPSHAMQVNLYALLIERNSRELSKKHGFTDPVSFAGAQVVYLPGKSPVRCEVQLDLDAVLNFLKERLTALLAENLPEVLKDSSDLWQCDYCPMRSVCEELNQGPVGKAANQDNQS